MGSVGRCLITIGYRGHDFIRLTSGKTDSNQNGGQANDDIILQSHRRGSLPYCRQIVMAELAKEIIELYRLEIDTVNVAGEFETNGDW
jgi:hypothetical protein